MLSLSRRSLGLAAAATLVLSACAPDENGTGTSSQDGGGSTTAINVAMITSITGALAAYGAAYKAGFEAGWAHVTNGTGKLDGYDVTFNWLDDQGNPDTAVNHFKDQVGKDAKIVAGPASSGIAAQLAGQAEQNKTLFISGAAAADAITGINKYTFRSGRQTYQDVATAGTMLDDLKGKKITVFAQDNAFGQGNVAGVKAVLGGKGATVSEILVAEDAKEFTPFATQIINAKPDLVFVAWAGATTAAMWQSLSQQGVFDKTTVVTGLGDVASYQAYGAASEKLQFLNHYFSGAAGTEIEKAMIDAVTKAGAVPDLFTPDGFVGAQMVARAISEGKGETDAMIAALEGWEFDSVKGRITVRKEDHAMLQPMYQAKLVKGADGKFAPQKIAEVKPDEVAPPAKA
ncbi:substrate-binding domain-containing protein [Propionibacteriaceae bacterium G1746]|uniref:substrate-binding domain-containing protein n=1 Tax=Aestuariimicrobium sp. G57 TaxID=3418485 RepID=UPI003C29E26C